MDDIIQHRQQEEAIRAFVQSLDPVQRYSQLFLVNLEGSRSFSPVESFQWGDLPEEALLPGGYLFFSYNIAETPAQVAEFTASIQHWSQQRGMVPPLLAVDQEGGMVNRLRSVTSPLPSARQVAQSLTASQAQSLYAAQAAQMSLLGFQMNLAIFDVDGDLRLKVGSALNKKRVSCPEFPHAVADGAECFCKGGTVILIVPFGGNIKSASRFQHGACAVICKVDG